jgi:hypothetical protein
MPEPLSHTLASAVCYLYLYTSSTSVKGVLGEFLDHRGGAIYDLTGGYLLGYEGIEYRYLTQEVETSISRLRD